MSEKKIPLLYVIDDDHDDFFFLKRVLLKRYPELSVKHYPKPDVFRDQMLTIDKPDAIILDINMPILNGFEVMNFLKNSNDWKNVPVLFLSTADDMKIKEKALASGAVNYLVKPIEPSDWDFITDQIMKEVNQV